VLLRPGQLQARGDKEWGSEQRWLYGARAAWQAALAVCTVLSQRLGMRVAMSHLGQRPASVPDHWPKNAFGNGM